MSYLKGNHLFNFGFNFTQINAWQAAANSSLLNTVTLAQATGDPDNTGATSLFTTTTLPGASATQLSDAANLYALIAGRVSRGDQFRRSERDHQDLRSELLGRPRPHARVRFLRAGYLACLFEIDPDRAAYAGIARALFRTWITFIRVPGSPVCLASRAWATCLSRASSPVRRLCFRWCPLAWAASIRVWAISARRSGSPIASRNGGIFHWLTGNDAVLRAGFGVSTNRQGIGYLDGVWNGNQGRSLATSASASANPEYLPGGRHTFQRFVFPLGGSQFGGPHFPQSHLPAWLYRAVRA